MSVVGLDLAGVESRPTGLCVLRGMRAETCLVYVDDEILKNIEKTKPGIVAIDAPLEPSSRKRLH